MEESQKLRKETSCAELQRSADPNFDIFSKNLVLVDGFEIRHHLGCLKNPCQKNGMNYQAQLVQDFFHQQ